MTYTMTVEADEHSPTLRVGFGEPAGNDKIVQDAKSVLDALIADGSLSGGPLLRVNGPASLPCAFVIAHGVSHLYAAIGVFDPKLGGYVIAVTHTSAYALGEVI